MRTVRVRISTHMRADGAQQALLVPRTCSVVVVPSRRASARDSSCHLPPIASQPSSTLFSRKDASPFSDRVVCLFNYVSRDLKLEA